MSQRSSSSHGLLLRPKMRRNVDDEIGAVVTRETGCGSSINYVNRRNKLYGWHLRLAPPGSHPAPQFNTLSNSRGALRIEVFVVVLSLGSELNVLVSALGILEDFAFVISDHDFFVVVIEDVAGIDRDFAAAAGSVDDKLRDAVAGRMAAQGFDDLDSFRDG